MWLSMLVYFQILLQRKYTALYPTLVVPKIVLPQATTNYEMKEHTQKHFTYNLLKNNHVGKNIAYKNCDV